MNNDLKKKEGGMNKMHILANTKIYKNYQTTIPKEIRKKFNIDTNNTIVEWSINEKGKTELNFRRKRDIKELKGMIRLNEKTDSVDLKKSLYK